MIEVDYPSHEQVVHLDWHTSGGHANGSGAARATWYGSVSGVPDVYFDGVDHVVGAGDSISAYNQYKPIVDNHYVNDGAKAIVGAQLDLDSDTNMATVTVDVEVAPGETIGNPAACTVFAALYEDDIILCCEPHTNNAVWHYIARAMVVETPLTASLSGETQQAIDSIAIDPSWNVNKLHAVAWVQRNVNKQVIQAAQASVQYDCEVAELDPPVAETQTTTAEYDAQVTYTGTTTDDVDVKLDESTLPAGWDAEIVWNSTTYPSAVTIPSMTTSQVEDITVRVIAPGGPGAATVGISVKPASNGSAAVGYDAVYYTYVQTPSILFVDDDAGATSETQFEAAIVDAGYFSLTRLGGVTDQLAPNFDAIVWNTGELATGTIGSGLQVTLQAYLDGGGALFLTSQGYLNHQGLTTLTTDYLRVSAFTSNVGAPSVTGLGGDPIGDGLAFTVSPPFTNRADAVVPGTGAVAWLQSGANDVGVRYDSGTFKTVFMTAPFEGLSGTDDELLMERVLDWLLPATTTGVRPAVAPGTDRLLLAQNAPNPFRGSTTVRFAIPTAGRVELTVFDVAGRRVARVLDGRLDAGSHAAVWDGRDSGGSRVAAGVYLVRLSHGGETLAREMVRIE